MDRYSSRHKSAGYVEFYEQRAVERAMDMNGVNLCGFPVAIRRIAVPGVAPSAGAGADELYARERRQRMRAHERPYEGAGAGAAPTAASRANSIGWSTRRPIRAVDHHGSFVVAAAAAQTAGGATRELVSVEELKRLLNPNNLPLAMNKAPTDAHVNGTYAANGATDGERESAQMDRRLYIGSIGYNVSEAELRAVFERFGAVESVVLQRDASGRSKGFAFVELASAEDAKRALETNGLAVGGKALTVALAAERADAGAARHGVVDRVPLPLVDVAGEIDEGREGGVTMNNAQRMMLMQELSRGEMMGNKLKGDVHKLKSCEQSTRSVVLSNMFDPASEEQGFEKELLEEVRDECMAKYGKVLHMHVETESHGIVYLRFSAVEEAVRARNELSGRWFGGKKIAAAFVSDGAYSERFPTAA